MRMQDKRSHYEICELFKWANEDDFWQNNILSPSKLRKQWDQLTTKRLRSPGPSKTHQAPVRWTIPTGSTGYSNEIYRRKHA